jgi:DNA-binding HxlR family transcriptional regulator
MGYRSLFRLDRHRRPYPELPPRVECSPTESGLSLDHVIAEMERWSHRPAGANEPAGRRWG